jgi:hypothetical protein
MELALRAARYSPLKLPKKGEAMSSAQLVFKRYETKHLLDAERPAYKEKTRTRCYGTPHPFDPVFVELKKNATGSFISVVAALTAFAGGGTYLT